MGAVEEAGKVAGSVVESLKSAREDKRAQLEMIAKLVTDIRDCKQGARP